jgi:hypothetical protein
LQFLTDVPLSCDRASKAAGERGRWSYDRSPLVFAVLL